MLLRGEHATAEELPPRAAREPLAHRAGTACSACPTSCRSGLLNGRRRARVQRGLLPARAARASTSGCEAIGPYFHPLDAVAAWNRLYGPRGFVQYQAVVPDAEGDAVRALLERVSGAGTSSFLAVLKRFGEGTGMLSFPMRRAGRSRSTSRSARATSRGASTSSTRSSPAAGGRVYLAKDARVRPELLRRDVPATSSAGARSGARADPEGLMRSDLARRLGLMGG